MSSPNPPEPYDEEPDLSGLGRTLLGTQPGSLVTKASPGPWQPPTVEELQKLLPQYEITNLLGRGGMGAVYQGRQISLDRPVAIKILSAELDDADLGFAERFKNEARAMAKLSHPGIVGVYDSGQTADGLLYIVMEFIEGTDVQQMISASKRLHTEHAMAIAAHVCDALAYAHERGIIHRDIKPANIMVGYDGSVKVTDFGLAKVGSVGQTAGLTQSGMTMGTLHYMAPEALILGTAVDQRADIYAVGVMLYQMLTGKLPQGMFELPSLQVAGLDPRYDGIIAKALRDDRERRYQNAMEMRRELDAILTQPVVKADPEATSVDAAAMLPTQVRPQRPGGKPFRAPQLSAAHPQRTSRSLSGWLIWTVLGAVALSGGYVWLNRNSQSRQSESEQPSGHALASTAAITPATATKDTPFVNSLGMKFVPVPGTGILICIHETRSRDYAAYAAEASGIDETWKGKMGAAWKDLDKSDYPAASLSWDDSRAFCIWISNKEGISYRLPTDREWSAAVGIADAEDTSATPETLSGKRPDRFPWGSQWPPPKDAGNYGVSLADDGFPRVAPVMSFKPNSLGIYDLGGNLWEWLDDWWNERETARVSRGGAWNVSDRVNLLSSDRIPRGQGIRNMAHGFRVVVEIAAATAAEVSSSTAIPPSIPATSTASAATKDSPFVNSLGMKFVPVPITGGPTDKQRVLFSVWETRVQDYEVFAKEKSFSWQKPPFQQNPTHPAVNVSWDDAQAFCSWLTEREHKTGKLGENQLYRLPSDHEWSCAVGIGDQENPELLPWEKSRKMADVFPWGSEWPPPVGTGNFSGEETKGEEIYKQTQFSLKGYRDDFIATSPVGSFAPDRMGLYDLSGNASEWCQDWFDATQKDRVVRGGHWCTSARGDLLSSSRSREVRIHRYNGLGFRVVVSSSVP